jgi:hypothetical protein
MLFDGWSSIGQIVLLAVGTYVLLIVALRVAGAQALAKMSAYDLVITIALGSIVATIPLSSGVSLADGAAIVVTYLGIQALTRASVKKVAGRPATGEELARSGAVGWSNARRAHAADQGHRSGGPRRRPQSWRGVIRASAGGCPRERWGVVCRSTYAGSGTHGLEGCEPGGIECAVKSCSARH